MIKKLTLLNETILDFLNEKNEIKIVKAFTELGVNILEADFGFVWLKQSVQHKWALIYKTPNLPFEPNKPRITGINDRVMKSRKIEYIKGFKNTPYTSDAGKHMKSFVIIPISFKEKAYGTIVLCFKKEQSFSREKKILGTFLGNGIAQIITIHQSREKTDKLKEAAIFLGQEKSKIEFIANATHELRTPVAIMKGNVDLILQNKNKKLRSPLVALRAIDAEINHLSGILSDLALITSKKNESRNRVVYSEIQLKQLVATIVQRFKIIALKKDITITVGSFPATVLQGDKVYLELLFVNLIKNAILYGKRHGHIKITAKQSKGRLVVSVADDGIGISKEDLPHVFERFYRADKSHNSDGNSTGLGLAIVKWIVEAHNGTIAVSSSLNKGSVFFVTIPINKVI